MVSVVCVTTLLLSSLATWSVASLTVSVDQERMELGVNIFVTSGLLCVTAIYFSVIDPLRPAGSSVTVLVRRTFERTSRSSGYNVAS